MGGWGGEEKNVCGEDGGTRWGGGGGGGGDMTVRVCVIVKSVTYSGSKISSEERRNEKEREIRSSC